MDSRTRNLATRILPAFASLMIACASNPEPTPPPAPVAGSSVSFDEGVPGRVEVRTVDVSARVVAIDAATRKVTLLGPDGNQFPVKVGPEAVNFDQIAVGDVVVVTLTEELVIALADASDVAADGSAALVALAPKGGRPGGVMAETTRITGTVTAIDAQAHTATLAFADGSSRTLPVRPDVDLTKRQVGERVVFQVTEMIAIRVVKQP